MPPTTTPEIDLIDQISGGYRAAQVLLTANRLGLFETLGDQRLTAGELARRLEADERGMRIMCDALASLGVLNKHGNEYSNSEAAKESLLPGSPKCKIAILKHGAKLYETWGQLYDSVKTGRPADPEKIDPRLLGDEKDFAAAMADVGRIIAQQCADLLDLSDVKTLLDIGGGPGLYSIEFARRNPHLQATVLDNEKTLAVAKANIGKAGLQSRVHIRPGDAFTADYGNGYDFIFLSNFVHIFSFEQNANVIRRCSQALAPRGRICVKDFILEPDRISPQNGALFAVNMLVNTETGDCYTVEDVERWFQDAGLQLEQVLDMTAQSRLVVGRKG